MSSKKVKYDEGIGIFVFCVWGGGGGRAEFMQSSLARSPEITCIYLFAPVTGYGYHIYGILQVYTRQGKTNKQTNNNHPKRFRPNLCSDSISPNYYSGIFPGGGGGAQTASATPPSSTPMDEGQLWGLLGSCMSYFHVVR